MKNQFIAKVLINRRVYEDMVVFASRHANEKIDADKQREVYGILVGNIDEQTKIIRVNQAIGILAGERTAVEFESKQYVDLSNIDESIWKQSFEYERGDFICGWWHSHPGFGLFYSHTDILNHLGFQSANPYAIGIVYDYKLRKTSVKDPGIEVFTLEDAKYGQRSNYERVSYEIVEIEHALDHIDNGLMDILKNVAQKSKLIKKITEDLQKKQLAQLQRNFGLLLLKKIKSKKLQKENIEQEEPGLYEWNEEELKKKYEIPKYRKNIEAMLVKAMKSSTNRKTNQDLILKELKKPRDTIQGIKKQFDELVEQITTIRRWLDAEERLKIKNFSEKLNQYINVLNALLTKAFYLDPREDLRNSGLFDPEALNKQYYGQEEEEFIQESEVISPKIGVNIPPISIATNDNLAKTGWESTSEETKPPVVKISINQMQPVKIAMNPQIEADFVDQDLFPLLPVTPSKSAFHIDYDELFDEKKNPRSEDDGWN